MVVVEHEPVGLLVEVLQGSTLWQKLDGGADGNRLALDVASQFGIYVHELAVLLGKHFCTLVALDVVLDVKHALQRLGDGSSQ